MLHTILIALMLVAALACIAYALYLAVPIVICTLLAIAIRGDVDPPVDPSNERMEGLEYP